MEGWNNQYEIRRYKNGLQHDSNLLKLGNELKMAGLKSGSRTPRILRHAIIAMKIWEIPQVLESLFGQVKILELKRFRLVCKKWNTSACMQLRSRTYVNLAFLSGTELHNFWNVWEDSQETTFSNPFKRYAMSIEITPNEIIEQILMNPSTEVISLSYVTDRNITHYSKHFKNLHYILQNQGQHLTNFTYKFSNFEFKSGDGWYSSELELPTLHLPALKEFNFLTWSYRSISKQTSFCKFLHEILLASRNLVKFCTNSDDTKILHNVLSACNGTIEGLFLKKISIPILQLLKQNKLPQLKSLSIIPHISVLSLNSELIMEVVRNFAPGIKELSLSKLSSACDDTFPILPNLEKLLLHDSTSNLKMISSYRFPKLKSVYLASFKTSSITSAQERYEYFSTDPHLGVENFFLKCSLSSDGRDEASKIRMEQDLIFLMAFISHQFPGITYLHLSMSKCLRSLVRAVVKYFPEISNLSLELLGDACFPEDIFTGHDSPRTLFHGSRNKPCLADMLCLRELKLSAVTEETSATGNYLSHNAIKFGIAAIPELEVLQMDWHEDLDLNDVQVYLADLSQVILVKSDNILVARNSIAEEISGKRSNLRLLPNTIKKRDDSHEVNIFDFRNYN